MPVPWLSSPPEAAAVLAKINSEKRKLNLASPTLRIASANKQLAEGAGHTSALTWETIASPQSFAGLERAAIPRELAGKPVEI